MMFATSDPCHNSILPTVVDSKVPSIVINMSEFTSTDIM
jgi:hypothetical protein